MSWTDDDDDGDDWTVFLLMEENEKQNKNDDQIWYIYTHDYQEMYNVQMTNLEFRGRGGFSIKRNEKHESKQRLLC